MNEPQIHSHIKDHLPEGHPLANESVDCTRCSVSVHAWNNECMQTWVETGQGNFCLECFINYLKERDTTQYALTVLKDDLGVERIYQYEE